MIAAKFVCRNEVIYEADVDGVPSVGESVMLMHVGSDEGANYRVLKREWKMTKHQGFNQKVYSIAEAYLYVEEV